MKYYFKCEIQTNNTVWLETNYISIIDVLNIMDSKLKIYEVEKIKYQYWIDDRYFYVEEDGSNFHYIEDIDNFLKSQMIKSDDYEIFYVGFKLKSDIICVSAFSGYIRIEINPETDIYNIFHTLLDKKNAVFNITAIDSIINLLLENPNKDLIFDQTGNLNRIA